MMEQREAHGSLRWRAATIQRMRKAAIADISHRQRRARGKGRSPLARAAATSSARSATS